MTTYVRLKQHDTAPALRVTVTDEFGELANFTPATVKVIGKLNGVLVFSRPATTKTNQGIITMAWQPADTATPGLLRIEIEATWPDGTVQSYPPSGYLSVQIDPDLG